MLLLVSGRHVGAHLGGHQHANLYKFGENVSPHIFHKKNCSDLNLGEGLCISTFFLFPDSGLNLLTGFDFLFWSILNGVTLKTSNSHFVLTGHVPFDEKHSKFRERSKLDHSPHHQTIRPTPHSVECYSKRNQTVGKYPGRFKIKFKPRSFLKRYVF